MAEATWSCAPAFVTAECLLRGRMSPCRGAGMERSRLSPATPDCPSLVLGWPDASCGVSFWSEGESRNETDAKVGVNDERAEPRLARPPQPSTPGIRQRRRPWLCTRGTMGHCCPLRDCAGFKEKTRLSSPCRGHGVTTVSPVSAQHCSVREPLLQPAVFLRGLPGPAANWPVSPSLVLGGLRFLPPPPPEILTLPGAALGPGGSLPPCPARPRRSD